MGNAESGISNKVGFHVLQVQPGSPAAGHLAPFWDVVVGAQQQIFDSSWKDSKLVELFKTYENKPLTLLVHNIRTDKTREVVVVPNARWGGTGLVGISIRFCSFEHTLELVWRVLDVYVDSPASMATLCARTDFIIGTPDHVFTNAEDFFNLINISMNKAVRLYVYSTLTEDVRIVSITPNKDWGGSGSLGCDIGYGYLHRIPMGNTQNNAEIQSATNTTYIVTNGTATNINMPTSPQANAPATTATSLITSELTTQPQATSDANITTIPDTNGEVK